MATKSTPRSRDTNPLSKEHFERIIKRPIWLKNQLDSVVGLTWNLKGRRICPLGAASLLVQYSEFGQPTQLCIAGEFDADANVVRYSRVRMCHDWGRNPHAGALGRVLDPREASEAGMQSGHKPNASWVRLGLGVDAARVEACRENYTLPASPQLPVFHYGYAEPPDFTVVTEALAATVAVPPDAEGYDQLCLGVVLDSTVSPHAPDNPTGLYLVPVAYMASPGNYAGIFEDFKDLTGAAVLNPLLECTAVRAENPTWKVARQRRIHLRTLLTDMVRSVEGEDISLDERAASLLSGIRERLGVMSDAFLEADLVDAMLNPDVELVSTKGVLDRTPADRAEIMRGYLQKVAPHILDGCADDDLLQAAEAPHAPLFASKLCGIQTVRRDPKVPPLAGLDYTPEALGRPGVYARLCSGDWDWHGKGKRHEHSGVSR